MKRRPLAKKVIYSSIVILIALLFCLFSPFDLMEMRFFFPFLAVLALVFLILGIVIIFLAIKEKGRLKVFLLITGISAISPLVFSILHNVFYGMAEVFENLRFFFEILHVGSFLISVIGAPLLFVIGAIGSLYYLKEA